MDWNRNEALEYYRRQGAPKDQTVLITLLTEIQQEYGSIPRGELAAIAEFYGIKEALLLALIQRVPRLHLADTHTLEVCATCKNTANLASAAEQLQKKHPGKLTVKFVPCMRMCGKGPNLRWDGKIFHHADTSLLEELARNL